MNLSLKMKNRMLMESLTRMVDHLGDLGGPVSGTTQWDDYHCALQLIGKTDEAWDKEASERGFNDARYTVLGV